MDRDIDVRTPERVAVSYQLAGLGSRFLALGIDQAIQLGVFGAIVWGIVLVAGKLPAHTPKGSPLAEQSTALGIAIVIALIFAVFFAYFIVFESLWNGQTPGKRALGIRVLRDGGYPLDFGAALIRNLIRVGEFALGYYAASAVSTIASPENKRLGDIAAGTIVVRDTALAVPLEVVRRRAEPVYAGTRFLSGEERAVVKRFLDRRDRLALESRRSIAARLAGRIRARVPADLQRLDDEALLERL